MSKPSEKAIEAARRALLPWVMNTAINESRVALKAAHDPVLGLDRSVCLRDVLDWADQFMDEHGSAPVRSEYEREFGGES